MVNTEDRRKRIPSQINDRYWLLHYDESYVFKKPSGDRQSGKWLVFDTPEKIDMLWKTIIVGLDNGVLGPAAKVSTSKTKRGFENQENRVICVYTEDYNDVKDVWRVESQLRNLGVASKITYKLDVDAGKYEKDNKYKDLIKFISF